MFSLLFVKIGKAQESNSTDKASFYEGLRLKYLNRLSEAEEQMQQFANAHPKESVGYFELAKKGDFLTRQSANEVFELNASFYFYRRAFFSTDNKKVINDKSLIHLMKHICFDLDHPIDFEFMSYLLENNKIDFSF